MSSEHNLKSALDLKEAARGQNQPSGTKNDLFIEKSPHTLILSGGPDVENS